MTNELEVTEQQQSRSTRRAVVATGVKVAYAAPVLAASFKLSASNAFAAASGGFCGHSTGINGGCMPACTSAATANNCPNPGDQCNDICGTSPGTGACKLDPGDDNPCCNTGYCDPRNYTCSNTQKVQYNGPTTGCPPTVTTTSKSKKK